MAKDRFESAETQDNISAVQSSITILNNQFAFGVTEGTADVPANGGVISFDVPKAISGATKMILQPCSYTNPSYFQGIVLGQSSSKFACRVQNNHTSVISKADWRVFWMQIK